MSRPQGLTPTHHLHLPRVSFEGFTLHPTPGSRDVQGATHPLSRGRTERHLRCRDRWSRPPRPQQPRGLPGDLRDRRCPRVREPGPTGPPGRCQVTPSRLSVSDFLHHLHVDPPGPSPDPWGSLPGVVASGPTQPSQPRQAEPSTSRPSAGTTQRVRSSPVAGGPSP